MQKTARVYEIVTMTDKQDKPALYLSGMIDAVISLTEEVKTFDTEAYKALKDYQILLQTASNGSKEHNWGSFVSFWGRGQQNLSFVRK